MTEGQGTKEEISMNYIKLQPAVLWIWIQYLNKIRIFNNYLNAAVTVCTAMCTAFQEKCAQYWPSERSARYQYFVVDPLAEYNMPQYILREFKVSTTWFLKQTFLSTFIIFIVPRYFYPVLGISTTDNVFPKIVQNKWTNGKKCYAK